MPMFSFLLVSSHHHPSMNYHYIFLLLLVVLSAYSESPQHANLPDPPPIGVTVYLDSISTQLGVLAPVLPQNEVYRIAPPQNEVYKIAPPQNEVYEIVLPQNEVYKIVQPQNEVYKIAPPQNEVYEIVLPQNEVYKIAPPQNEVYEIVLPQNEVYKIAPPQTEVVLTLSGVFDDVIVNCQLFNGVKNTVGSLLNLGDKSFKILTSTLIHGGKILVWTIRILLESLQHVLKMYTWSLSENQASIQFRCRLIGLLLKQSLFRKHDFAVCLYKVYHDYQNLGFWHLKFFSN